MGLQLLIPRSAAEPRSKCFMCGKEFPAEQWAPFMRHVKSCAKANHDQFEAKIAAGEETYFTSSPDPELDAHLAAGGK